MGIKGEFNKFLTEKNSKHKLVVPLSKFKNKSITIDSGIWFYSNMAAVTKNYVSYMKNPLEPIDVDELFIKLVRNFISFNTKLLRDKVTPIWIWDGNKQGGHKKKEREKRSEKRENDNRLKCELEEILREQNPLKRSEAHIKKYKDLLCRISFLTFKMKDDIKEIANLLGIPNIQAEGEAENLAASLVVEELAKGVWTRDTDVYPMLPKYVLGALTEVGGFTYVEVSLPHEAKDALNLDEESFRDFCIMCGTDFNDNIPKCGMKTSYKLIVEYKKIEHIEMKKGESKECLNFEVCRELLSPFETGYKDKKEILTARVVDQKSLEELGKKYPHVNHVDIIRGIRNLKYKI